MTTEKEWEDFQNNPEKVILEMTKRGEVDLHEIQALIDSKFLNPTDDRVKKAIKILKWAEGDDI